jgi:hypothetical protein
LDRDARSGAGRPRPAPLFHRTRLAR